MSEEQGWEYIDSRVCQKDFTLCGNRWTTPHVVEILNVLDVTTESSENAKGTVDRKSEDYDEKNCTWMPLQVPTTADIMKNRIRKVRRSCRCGYDRLDDFKLYNDTCGHNAGDLVLNTVVGIIRGCIRKTDILIRYGGDEFLLILQDVDEEIFSKS